MALSEIEQRVVNRLKARRESIEQDLERWVAIPTGWNHTAGLDELRAILRSRVEALGGVAEELPGDPAPPELAPQGSIPPTLIVRGPRHGASANHRAILFSGHLDTVFDPKGSFVSMKRTGDRAVGPGVSDMKGGLALMIAALEVMHAEGVAPAWTVVLNSDEETGSFHSIRHLRALAKEHAAAIVLEPAMADGGMVVERLGSGQVRLEATGRAAHAGRDFASGISAIDAMAEATRAASRLSDPTGGRIVNIGMIRGGEAPNIVPDKVVALGSVRYRDRAGGEEIARGLASIERGTNEALPRVAVQLWLNRPAKPLTAALRPLVELCVGASRDLGVELKTGATGGSSDGNILDDAGLPSLDSLGVRGGNLHRTDEFVELSTLVDRAALLAVTAMRVATASPVTRA